MADPHRKGILRTESVFKNPKALSPDWIPEIGQKLLGQDGVITKLICIHRPIIENKGEFSTNTLIIGPNCGKTLTVRYFLSRFTPFALQSGLTIRTWYCNCLSLRTKSAVLRSIAEGLEFPIASGFADNEIATDILANIVKYKQYFFLILDEVHNLSSEDLLALLNMTIAYGTRNSRFSIICIARPEEWYKIETEKISSRIQEKISMPPYSVEEAAVILRYRRNLAFREGVLADAQVDSLARIVGATQNMRMGIDLMRVCGQRCDTEKIGQITETMIQDARNQVNAAFRPELVGILKTQEQLVLLAIARTLQTHHHTTTTVEESYAQYQIESASLRIDCHVTMTFRKYLRNLAAQNLVKVEYLNPTVEKKGRQVEIHWTEIPLDPLITYLETILAQQITCDD